MLCAFSKSICMLNLLLADSSRPLTIPRLIKRLFFWTLKPFYVLNFKFKKIELEVEGKTNLIGGKGISKQVCEMVLDHIFDPIAGDDSTVSTVYDVFFLEKTK